MIYTHLLSHHEFLFFFSCNIAVFIKKYLFVHIIIFENSFYNNFLSLMQWHHFSNDMFSGTRTCHSHEIPIANHNHPINIKSCPHLFVSLRYMSQKGKKKLFYADFKHYKCIPFIIFQYLLIKTIVRFFFYIWYFILN